MIVNGTRYDSAGQVLKRKSITNLSMMALKKLIWEMALRDTKMPVQGVFSYMARGALVIFDA